jgi:hypothetical protein
MAFKDFQAGAVLTAAQVDEFLMAQVIATFASAGARGSAIGTPVTGQFTFLTDTLSLEFWDGAAWSPFSAGGGGGGISEFLLMGA